MEGGGRVIGSRAEKKVGKGHHLKYCVCVVGESFVLQALHVRVKSARWGWEV